MADNVQHSGLSLRMAKMNKFCRTVLELTESYVLLICATTDVGL